GEPSVYSTLAVSGTEPSNGTPVETGPDYMFDLGGEGHKFMDFPIRGQSGTAWPTEAVIGFSTPVGSSGSQEQLDQGQGRG
ncbi:hypothetical protein HAX54_020953, partial [Datura stramonium]|nr:hypothetical protein [Datura stramonium]